MQLFNVKKRQRIAEAYSNKVPLCSEWNKKEVTVYLKNLVHIIC